VVQRPVAVQWIDQAFGLAWDNRCGERGRSSSGLRPEDQNAGVLLRLLACITDPEALVYGVQLEEAEVSSRNGPSFAVALNCGIGSKLLKELVNALDRLHIVRGANSSNGGLK
jgi:methionine synthase I (cobalamin-dependent)